MKLNVFNIVILIGAIQALIFGVLHLLNNRKGVSNKFLGLLLIAIATSSFSFFVFDSRLEKVYSLSFVFTFTFENAIGPLIYFYIKRLLDERFVFTWKHSLLFSPILIDIVVFITRMGIFGRDITYVFNKINIYTIIISITVYLSATIIMIYKHHRDIKGKKDEVSFLWAKKVIITLIITFLIFIIFRKTYFLEHRKYTLEDNYPFYIIFSVWVYWIGISAYIKTIIPIKNKKNEVYNKVSEKDIATCATEVRNIIEREKIYLNPEITLKDVAEKINASPQLLSYVLNSFYRKNFNTLINEYRIEEFKKKVIDVKYDHLSILGIAFECGFNSKSTFNAVFKKITGLTPQQFKLKHKK